MTVTTMTSTEAITARSQQNGGGTFAPSGLPVASGIAVTVEVVEKVEALSAEAVETGLGYLKAGDSLGTWLDDENGMWEVSRTVVFEPRFRQAAMEYAASMGERYVYDLDADECIAVP